MGSRTVAALHTLLEDNMKKMFYGVIVLAAGLFASCLSIPSDIGAFNPDNVPEENLATLYIGGAVYVEEMDNVEVDWRSRSIFADRRIIRIPPGVHSFSTSYQSVSQYSRGSITVIGTFESGRKYFLKSIINGNRVKMAIVRYDNLWDNEDVTLDLNKLRGNDSSDISAFIKYILSPTSDTAGNSVQQENDDYILLFGPDMEYTLTDKKTGVATAGRHGFSMSFQMANAKVFLLETDIQEMSREDFLKSDYQNTAQTVLVPVKCTQDEVTYRYERPEALAGTELVFKITEIKK
jgi:hypothetical protein